MNMTNNRKKIAIGTLGCRLNQFESDSLATDFRNAGYDIVSINEYADVYIINTCTVTNKSDAKSRNMIRKAHKTNPEAILIVTGCYADTNKKDIARIKGVDYIIGNKRKSKVYQLIDRMLNERSIQNSAKSNIESYPETSFDYTSATKGTHTRSFVKIQDGCDVKCTYCKIPYARGKPISKPSNAVINDIKTLYENGYREFILTGINIIYYNDRSMTLSGLLKVLYKIDGDFRIRLSSVEPDKITDDLLDVLSHQKMGQHLHIPLQSGSDRILQAMGRRYNVDYYVNLINRIKKQYPNLNITTDIIIGFPGESESDFDKTYNVVKECGFSHVHTFKYSKRSGTPASEMPGQVDEKAKNHRSKMIRTLSNKQNINFRLSQIGRRSKVLIETISKDGYGKGFTDNYIKVMIPINNKSSIQQGEFVEVRLDNVIENSTLAVSV
jgi:threonylcarbamoyladenosine tRNA methylthiotransferase MtaB